jgi:hypothetical protein
VATSSGVKWWTVPPKIEEECPSVIKNSRKRLIPNSSNPIEFGIGNGDSIAASFSVVAALGGSVRVS